MAPTSVQLNGQCLDSWTASARLVDMELATVNAVRHVLVVDATVASIGAARAALGGMDLEAVDSPTAALERIVMTPFDVALLDPTLCGPDDDAALAILHRLRTV